MFGISLAETPIYRSSKSLFRYYRLGRVRLLGAPVYLHWTAIVAIALLSLTALGEPLMGAIAVLSYLSVIVVHELGHAVMARRYGCRVIAIKIGWLHGLCEYEQPYREWPNVVIAWGGVLAQLVIGAVAVIAINVWPDREWGYFGPVIVFWGYVNVLIVPINLAPSAPLDGHLAWRIIPLWRARRRSRSTSKSKVTKLRRRR